MSDDAEIEDEVQSYPDDPDWLKARLAMAYREINSLEARWAKAQTTLRRWKFLATIGDDKCTGARRRLRE